MGWWPFGKKRQGIRSVNNDPLLKDTRTWISELRDTCEMNFDQPEEARRQIRQMQVEWRDAVEQGSSIPQTGKDWKVEPSACSLVPIRNG